MAEPLRGSANRRSGDLCGLGSPVWATEFFGRLENEGYDNELRPRDRDVSMNSSDDQHIVPGISISSSGQATVDPLLVDVLFDLAIKLEEPTNLPVDVEHVLAAIVLAARSGELDPNLPLSSDDPALAGVLAGHVKTVFADYGGKVGTDD